MKTQDFKASVFIAGSAVLLLSLIPAGAAISEDTSQQALDTIANFADRLCQTVPIDIQSSRVELNGSAKAELAGVIKKLANFGVDGAGKYSTDESKNVLQKDLAQTLQGSRDCRLQVWNDLKTKFNIGNVQPPAACRDRSHGVENYRREYDVTQTSPMMGGGFDQPRWCQQAIAQLQSQNADNEYSVRGSSENSHSTCPPLNCPQYQYTCTIHVKADPIYVEKVSPACK
ncbi:hypothetical protein [Caballeronia concitans]|uniref:Lipoprotein n=1 Tax=Caballeronia concitans TaxID=1777133 RepID=A0A658R684_9BURK|nr:hypothetical protein [Caballeronia concitans]SAL52440.1 hypothetical protein AWB72_05584 [Caballeronia concitans]